MRAIYALSNYLHFIRDSYKIIFIHLSLFLVYSGGGDQHGTARHAEAAVSQDQDGGHFHFTRRGHQKNPQQGVHVASLQARHTRRLNSSSSSSSNEGKE